MTQQQLEDFGVIFDTWTSLSGLCHQIIFTNETHLYSNRDSYQFYFESDSNLVFVRQIEYLSDSLSGINSPYVVEFTKENGDLTYAKLINGGAIDNTVGVYHSVHDLNQLIGLF